MAAERNAAAQAAQLDQILAYLRRARKGKATHNRDAIAGGLGKDRAKMEADEPEVFDRLYSAMKADARFIFRPDGLPASFALAKGARASRKAPAKA